MAEHTKIEWCHHTVNLWWGCTEVHAGCDNCYAKTLAHRRKPHLKLWGNPHVSRRMMIKSAFSDLDKYQRKAAKVNEVHRIFINSMSDIFESHGSPLIDNKGYMVTDGVHYYPSFISELRDELFENISAGKYPNLEILLLTKRPSNINKMIPETWKVNPPKNVMFGTSPVNQETFDKLVSQLSQVNGRKFLSIEPQLGPINIKKELPTGKGQVAYGLLMDWIINGGESGPKRRPYNVEWGRQIMNDCKDFDIPFFMKQIDKVIPIPDDIMIRQFSIPIQ